MAGFSKSNLYDALVDTVDRISRIERPQGYRADLLRRRYFQQTDLCQGHCCIQEGAVPIDAIGLMQALREYYDARGALGSIKRFATNTQSPTCRPTCHVTANSASSQLVS